VILVAGREGFGLGRFSDKLRHETRWQVYVRVLPVVFLAVLVVGAFGWIVFNRYATDRLTEHDGEEAAFLVDNLHQKILVETMGLVARMADIEFEARDWTASDSMVGSWATDFLHDKYLVGAALVVPETDTTTVAADLRLIGLSLTDSLSGPVNESRLRTWFAANRDYFKQGLTAARRSSVREPGAPVLAEDNPWHPTFIFPPVLLEEVSCGSQVSAGGRLAALLPVFVHEEQDRAFFHTVYFLSLNRMLDDLMGGESPISARNAWWCVVNHRGQVIDAATGTPTIGSLLKNQHRTHVKGLFSVVSGAELVGNWRMGQPWSRPLYGNHLSPWVVAAGQSAELPLTILVGHEAGELRATKIGYIVAVFGVALLALALAVFGVTRVVGRISDRVTLLARSLELVANGDYSHRMPTTEKDEIGRMIGYFNLMVVSLDETQRELTEKTRHLEVALENRRLLDRAKDEFLVLISHEVRTPLTAIMGGVNILRGLVDRSSGSEREVLDKLNLTEVVGIIESSGQRLHGFMNDAIQMTSIQSSDKKLMLQPTPVDSLIELGLCGVREMAQVRHIEIVNGLEHEREWLVLCDQKAMNLAFAKVLKNAVEHNYDQGRVVIREVDEVPGEGRVAALPRSEDMQRLMSLPSFKAFAKMPVTWRLIEIFNTGDAIPAEHCAALFGKFEIIGRIEHHQRGSGLSLPIAQAAIENHGGRIYVHSAKLQGNSFYLLVPTVAAADLVGWSPASIRCLNTVPTEKQFRNGEDSRAGNKDIGEVADPAGLKVELDHQRASLTGSRDQAGRRVDGASGADDEKDVTLGGRIG